MLCSPRRLRFEMVSEHKQLRQFDQYSDGVDARLLSPPKKEDNIQKKNPVRSEEVLTTT